MKVGIYRVENELGEGPYRSLDAPLWEDGLHVESTGHPNIFDDGFDDDFLTSQVLRSGCDIVCGLATLEGLQAWFTPNELTRLREAGFPVVRYWVEDRFVQYGRTQVLFERRRATLYTTR